MTTTRRRKPTMFQRRLIVLLVIGVAACALMGIQLVRLAVVEGGEHRAEAEGRLVQHEWIPTWRGTIFDRHGRPLARDEPGYEVAVAWEAITGSWASRMALREARREVGTARWNALSPEVREELVAARLPQWTAVLDDLWTLVAETRVEEDFDIDRELDQQRARIQRMAAVIWERQRQRHEARYGEGDDFQARPIAEQRQQHVVVPHVEDYRVVPLQRFAEQWPDLVQVRYARHREYPNRSLEVPIDLGTMPRLLRTDRTRNITVEDVGDHVLGGVRYDVWAEDVERRPFRDAQTGEIDRGGYRSTDRVGASGIERGWEDQLRGGVGVVQTSRRTGEVTREPPVPGNDVMLTIDAMLQARVEAILDWASGLTIVQPWHGNTLLPIGTRLAAAVVVLDIATGEILAMASMPKGDEDLTELARQELSPWINRAVSATYPPGSIVKPLVLAAAIMEGLAAPETTIECTGHHFPDRDDVARCWIYRPRYGMAVHGPLEAREALARSCNCYFYELGSRLGIDRLSRWMSWFGIGSPIATGLGGPGDAMADNASGNLPDAEAREALRRRGESTFESVMMGIGQGRLTWTPLHAADAFATLARGGRRLVPTIVRGHRGPVPDGLDAAEFHVAPHVVDAALEGLRLGVTEPWGTGSRIKYGSGDYEPIFTVPGVTVMGKTGTAQAPPWPRDVDGDGVLAPGEQTRGLEHAWFVGLVGDDDVPKYAISVLVEYGGSGGRVAGPIANQVIQALRDEGYLDGVLPGAVVGGGP
ncbi:MAG: hypothetical protein MK116_08365 [Phycisphaerales bacterium]|nr:hypothetical protein [Phycisphaerales bacterium]